MKKFLLGCLALLLIAAAPSPRGYVNDFANIIPDERESVLEQSLRDYEAQTSIEIAVVTTPSLDGEEIENYSTELFREWGVGKEGADNGVLIVIAPQERKYRVAVGYGLEGDLTDADSSVIAERSLVEPFRAGDYASGIESLTQRIITHLGTMSPAQRAEFHRKMNEVKRRNAVLAQAKLFDFLGTAFIFVLVLGGLVLTVLGIRSLLRKRAIKLKNARRRKQLLANLALVQSEADRVLTDLSAIDLPNLPSWMQDDKEQYTTLLEESLEKAFALRAEVHSLLKSNLDDAEEKEKGLAACFEEADKSLELLREIPEEVRAFRRKTEQVVAEASDEIDKLIARARLLSRKHYHVSALVPALDIERLKQEKENIASLLTNRGEGRQDASEVVHDKASRLLRKVRSLRESLDSSVETQITSERRIKALKERIPAFTALLQEHRARVQRLTGMAPRARWASFQEGLSMLERNLMGVTARTDAAVHANSMDVQLFAEAAATLAVAETSLSAVDTAIKEAAALETAVIKAKQEYSSVRNSVENAISSAQRLVSDSDVGSGAKGRLAEAKRMLANCNTEGSVIDWIALLALLEQASAKAKQASQLAQHDIDSAERERRRRRNEAARRQRQARESSTYSYSNFGSGSSSGGGFGGFGGGSTGGGGASGGW